MDNGFHSRRIKDIKNKIGFGERKIECIYTTHLSFNDKIYNNKKKKIFDKLFTFPTMQEMLDTLINFN